MPVSTYVLPVSGPPVTVASGSVHPEPGRSSRSTRCRFFAVRKKSVHRRGDHRPDARDLVDGLLAGVARARPWCRTGGPGARPPSCRRGGCRGRRAGWRAGAPWRRRCACHQLRRRLLREPFQLHELCRGQLVEIGHVADQLRVEQLPDPLLSQAADVHRLPGGEMDDPLQDPVRGRRGSRSSGRPRPPGARPACRRRGTRSGIGRSRSRAVPALRQRAQHLGDHLARADDLDPVADRGCPSAR